VMMLSIVTLSFVNARSCSGPEISEMPHHYGKAHRAGGRRAAATWPSWSHRNRWKWACGAVGPSRHRRAAGRASTRACSRPGRAQEDENHSKR
jgi:hypothetical protein